MVASFKELFKKTKRMSIISKVSFPSSTGDIPCYMVYLDKEGFTRFQGMENDPELLSKMEELAFYLIHARTKHALSPILVRVSNYNSVVGEEKCSESC